MKLFKKMKDGGPDSKVTGYFLIEWKRLFSVALLRFDAGSREAYHSHAFNSKSWLLGGHLHEQLLYAWSTGEPKCYTPSFKPITTTRRTFHKVSSIGRSWVLTFRGPWSKGWLDYNESTGELKMLTWGRKEV